MAKYRSGLPQLGDGAFLTDAGLETDLIFNRGYDLPHFAAFVLLADDASAGVLRDYFRDHAAIARDAGAGFVLESVTWRASPDWGERLSYTPDALAAANTRAVAMLAQLRDELGEAAGPLVVSGCIGPRGDGYAPDSLMSADEAEGYHATQVATFAAGDADLVHAMTITYPAEAVGIVRVAEAAGLPAAVSFTVETDGSLPDGTPLGEAISALDDATGGAAAYFGINCAHPSHFAAVLDPAAPWTARIRSLRDRLPNLTILGGCCGTDARHVRAVAEACLLR